MMTSHGFWAIIARMSPCAVLVRTSQAFVSVSSSMLPDRLQKARIEAGHSAERKPAVLLPAQTCAAYFHNVAFRQAPGHVRRAERLVEVGPHGRIAVADRAPFVFAQVLPRLIAVAMRIDSEQALTAPTQRR